MFVDKVTIQVQAGHGGHGKISFRHMRNHRGGPDGGDGGRGGDVVLRADHNTNSLAKYRTNKVWHADDGQAGGTNRKHGKSAAALELIVAPGTVVTEDGATVADLADDGASAVVARGGDGGFGNAHFTSSTRQAPRFAEVGEPGEAKELMLELKLIAEVGLIGLPNAGKSTLLSVVSNARPEIADYPFTTLVPNLGVTEVGGRSLLLADIPGLIEGASSGRGLGDEFLRHVERTRLLLHLVDAGSADITRDYQTIQTELSEYSRVLAKKPQIAVLTKSDTVDAASLARQRNALQKLGRRPGRDLFVISSQAHRGLDELLRSVAASVARRRPPKIAKPTLPVLGLRGGGKHWQVEQRENLFIIHGPELEKMAVRTNFDQMQAVARLRKIMASRGVAREIERLGAVPGTKVEIAGKRFRW